MLPKCSTGNNFLRFYINQKQLIVCCTREHIIKFHCTLRPTLLYILSGQEGENAEPPNS